MKRSGREVSPDELFKSPYPAGSSAAHIISFTTLMNYSALEPKEKQILITELSIVHNTRKMYIEDWLKKHDPEIETETLRLKKDKIADLIFYLRLRK